MAATPVTPVSAASPYTGGAALVWHDADVTDGLVFTVTERELVLFRNGTDTAALAATVVSVADELGRTGDITVNVALGTAAFDSVAVWGPSKFAGFASGSLTINIAQLAKLEVAVLRLS